MPSGMVPAQGQFLKKQKKQTKAMIVNSAMHALRPLRPGIQAVPYSARVGELEPQLIATVCFYFSTGF